MAFTVEDGTGLANANAYVSVAYVDAYFADRGQSAWAGSNTLKEQAIVRATDYIESRWRDSFLGLPEFPEVPQALSFPRINIWDRYGAPVEGIPIDLERATAEYALRALTTVLLPDPVVNAAGVIQGVREKVGPIETETTYTASPQVPTLRSYPSADRMLRPYILGGGRGRVYR